MEIKELRSKSLEELFTLEKETREELFKVRMQHYSGQLLDPSKISKLKKNVARILTVISEISE
jgi:large subunit ribosomal protein L29